MKRDIWWRQQKCWHGKKFFDAKSFFLELTYTLRDKCPNKELFLVLIFPRSEIFVFSPNTGKQKIWPRKNSLFGHFSHRDTHTDVDIYNDLEKFQDHIHCSIWLLTVTDRTMVRREKHANEFSFSVLPVCYTQKEAQVKWGLASLQNFSSKMKQFMHMDLTTIGFITIIYLKSRLYLVCAVALYTISEGFLTS